MVNQYCAHSFARNWQLPFLNQQKRDNDPRKYFMINLYEIMLPTWRGSWSPVRGVSELSHRGRHPGIIINKLKKSFKEWQSHWTEICTTYCHQIWHTLLTWFKHCSIILWPWPLFHTQQTHNIATTLLQRRCSGRCNDVPFAGQSVFASTPAFSSFLFKHMVYSHQTWHTLPA